MERVQKNRILRFWALVVYNKGRSLYRREIPNLIILPGENGLKIGEYLPNTISIWTGRHPNFISIASTILHEYEHYLQFWPWYTRYLKMYGYKNNPYEIKAIEAEEIAPMLLELIKDPGWKRMCRKNPGLVRIYDKVKKDVIFLN